MSYGPLALIPVHTIHQPTVHVCTRFQLLLPLQFLRKLGQKIFINAKLENLSRDITLTYFKTIFITNYKDLKCY